MFLKPLGPSPGPQCVGVPTRDTGAAQVPTRDRQTGRAEITVLERMRISVRDDHKIIFSAVHTASTNVHGDVHPCLLPGTNTDGRTPAAWKVEEPLNTKTGGVSFILPESVSVDTAVAMRTDGQTRRTDGRTDTDGTDGRTEVTGVQGERGTGGRTDTHSHRRGGGGCGTDVCGRRRDVRVCGMCTPVHGMF